MYDGVTLRKPSFCTALFYIVDSRKAPELSTVHGFEACIETAGDGNRKNHTPLAGLERCLLTVAARQRLGTGSFYYAHQFVNAITVGVNAEDAGTDNHAAIDDCAGQEDSPACIDPLEQRCSGRLWV